MRHGLGERFGRVHRGLARVRVAPGDDVAELTARVRALERDVRLLRAQTAASGR